MCVKAKTLLKSPPERHISGLSRSKNPDPKPPGRPIYPNAMQIHTIAMQFIENWPWTAQATVKLFVAAVLGGIIGMEREYHGRSAGFRTQTLVALGSALVMIVSLHFGEAYGDKSADTAYRVDPARLAYGIMAGIGFLGAGTIIRYNVGVRGLTTAASLWCTAAVGLACGFGMFDIAAIATGLVVCVLFLLSKLDVAIPSKSYRTVTVTAPISEKDNISAIKQVLESKGIKVTDIAYDRSAEARTETITFYVSFTHHSRPESVKMLADILPGATVSIR